MANTLSAFDDTLLNEAQKKQIAAYKASYSTAQASGDTSGMESAHSAAERVRASAGYSGGGDGSEYIRLTSDGGYSPGTIMSYEPQTEAAERAYDASTRQGLAALNTQYVSSAGTLEQEKGQIAASYGAQANAVEADNERAKQAMNERAAASGINSGAGTQAALSLNNAYQSAMSQVRAGEAAANADLAGRISQLKLDYNAKAAELKAQGEASKANAILGEYQAAAKSAASASEAQADENYRAYTSGYTAAKDRAETQYQTANDVYKRAASDAATLAKYGDFSGYAAIGYTDGQIAAMEQSWAVQNPLLAYKLGKISAREYYSIVYG